ncbi:hypothetical protein EYC80_006363 [Monilinia laxa]|uniref:NACHT domain-containing protein n=1 Tax=Monilinia laxa TaxID=61186 RepID=A0A5N6JRQ6_MONLA|nr:hypothetical protein EYC80_006363 [Monilinia laxa]
MANTETTSIDSQDPWLTAKDRFIIDLNETERALFNEATPENLYCSASNVQQADQKTSRTRAILRSLDPFMKAIQDYAAAMDTFANIAPLNLGPIWGSIRVVLALANNHGKFYDRMIETFARIGDILPRLRDYQAIFDQRKYPRFTQTLSAAYLDIIVLCSEFRKVLLEQKSSFVKRAFKPLSPSLRSYLEKAVQAFRERREAVESEARVCHMVEAKQARDLVLRNEMFSKAQEREQRQKRIIAQMATIDYGNKHRRMQKIRHQGTGKWLVDTHEYKSWRDCEKSCAMSFYGIPGSGKSVLISSLIDGSSSIPKVNTAVAYYYFDYADKRTLSPSSLFGCVAQQLLRSLKQIPDNLMEALEAEYPDGAGCPGVDQTIALLVKIIDEFPTVAIFIDGLDELPEADRKLTFSSLRNLLTTVVSLTRLFVSSREDTSYLFPTSPIVKRYKLHVQPNSIAPDIDSYIQHSIEELISTGDLVLGDLELKNVIFITLKNGAQGMFLWVKFQLEDLCRMETDAPVIKALQNLPRSLEETYDRLLGRIVEIERREYVKRMFDWIISSRRPLKADEIREAIAFTINDTFWDAAKIPNDLHRLVRSCGNLVVIDEDTEEVQLAHYTVEQYLLHTQNSALSYFHTTRENSNCELGKVCIAYLSFTDFETQITMYRDWVTPNMMVIEKAMTTHSLTLHAHHGSSIPSKATKAILSMRKQHEHTNLNINYSRIIPKFQSASETREKYRILSYVKDNWLLHTVGFTEKIRQGLVGQLFRQLLFEKNLIFRIKPWEKVSSTDVAKIALLGWAINESHLPLMEELIKHDENSFDCVLKKRAGNFGDTLILTEDLQSAVETGDLGKLKYSLDFLGKCSSSGVMARADYFGSEDWPFEWQICAYKLNAITAAAARGFSRAVKELLNCTILREI